MPNKSEQSRINGAKSKGPKSPEGKERSSRNAVKHGLNSRSLLLSNESMPDFQQMCEDYRVTFRPANRVENDLILVMVSARYRLNRAWAIETGIIDLEMCRAAQDFEATVAGHDEDLRKGAAYTSSCSNIGLINIQRQQVRLERTYSRALKELLILQDRRKKENQNEPDEDPIPMEPLDVPPPTYVTLPKEEVQAMLIAKTEKVWEEYRQSLITKNQNEPTEPVTPSVDTDEASPLEPAA